MNTYYTISEISKELSVEPHVLRNWESELALSIKRSHNGHRIYSPDDFEILVRTKDLKVKGFTLKQIRLLIPWFEKLQSLNDSSLYILKKRLEEQEEVLSLRPAKDENCVITLPVPKREQADTNLSSTENDSGKAEPFDLRIADIKSEEESLPSVQCVKKAEPESVKLQAIESALRMLADAIHGLEEG